MLKESSIKNIVVFIFLLASVLVGIGVMDRVRADEGLNNETQDYIRIHWQRKDEKYEPYGLWIWGEATNDQSENVDAWPVGATAFDNEIKSDFGAFVDIKLDNLDGDLNFILVSREDGNKINEFTNIEWKGKKDLYLREGSEQIFDDKDEALNADIAELVEDEKTSEVNDNPEKRFNIRVHYLLDEDKTYEDYGLWVWGDAVVPSDQEGEWPLGPYAFSEENFNENGSFIDIEMLSNARVLNFIVVNRETGEKVLETVYADFQRSHNLYIKEGDDRVYDNPEYKIENSISSAVLPDWAEKAVIYEVNIRQYTQEGTFSAFEEHLPRLKDLGVDILWIMPIHPISEVNRNGNLGSYYAVRDYYQVNPEFGNKEDFKKLVDKAHEMGFKVVLDWVANHTGWDHSWITDHPEYYIKNSNGEIISPEGWIDVAKLDYENSDLREQMYLSMKYWVDEFNIDGFRADHAAGVPVDFWEDVNSKLQSLKPLYMLAEDNTINSLLNSAFVSNWGWNLHHIMNDIAKGERDKNAVINYFNKLNDLYPDGSFPTQFIDSHDENSWEGTISERLGNSSELMSVLYFTVPGMPMMYSGQEANLNHRLKFFDKDEISWNDLSLQEHYKKLIDLKHDNEALWNGNAGGNIKFLETENENILIYKRIKGDNSILVVLNLSDETNSIDLSNEIKKFEPVLESKQSNLSKKSFLTLEGWGYSVYANKDDQLEVEETNNSEIEKVETDVTESNNESTESQTKESEESLKESGQDKKDELVKTGVSNTNILVLLIALFSAFTLKKQLKIKNK